MPFNPILARIIAERPTDWPDAHYTALGAWGGGRRYLSGPLWFDHDPRECEQCMDELDQWAAERFVAASAEFVGEGVDLEDVVWVSSVIAHWSDGLKETPSTEEEKAAGRLRMGYDERIGR